MFKTKILAFVAGRLGARRSASPCPAARRAAAGLAEASAEFVNGALGGGGSGGLLGNGSIVGDVTGINQQQRYRQLQRQPLGRRP